MKLERTASSKPTRPLIGVLAGAFILLGIAHAAMFYSWEPRKVLPDLPWVVPVTNAMVMLSACSVALLSFGRYAVRRDTVSFWTGLGFAALATCQVFYVLAWPGLLPDGRAIIGKLPSTAAWIAMLALVLPGLSLLAAVWARWPGRAALPGKRWLWLVGGCLVCLLLMNVVLVSFEKSLPVLVEPGGQFTPLLRSFQWSITLLFGLGALASARYYLKTGDTLPAYAALSQVFLFFFELAILLGGTRYGQLFFADRFLVIGGFVAILFGLLLEHVRLYRGEVERTNDLERSGEKLRQSEERYRQLFDDDLTGDFISSPEGRVLLCNPSFARMFGFSSVPEAVGTNMRELYPDPGEQPLVVEKVRQERKVERLEVWRRRRDGTPIHIVENLVGHFDARGELFEIKGYLFDDTERKRAEEALQESKQRFATLVEQAPVGIFETDSQGDCIFVNDYWQELAGLSAGEAAGKGWMSGIHPEDRERVCAEWYAAAQGQREFTSEYRFRTPNGKVSWVIARAKPIQDGAGGVVRHLGTLLDITERKRADELQVLEDVFRVAPSFLHVLRGPKFIFEFANEAYYGLVGHRDLIGRPAFEAMPEAAEGGYPQRLARVMETGEAFFGRELPVTLARTPGAEPEERIIDLVYLPLKDADGRCSGVLGHGTDVTEHVRERKRVTDELRNERDFSAAVLDTAGALVVVLDRAGLIQRFNRACAVLTGYAEEEVLGRPVWFLIPPEDLPSVREEWNVLNSGSLNSRHENHWLARDGTRRLIAWSNTVLIGAEGEIQHIIGTGLDITEQKRAEMALKESEARMARAQALAHLGSWELDTRNNRLTWSDETFRIFGYEAQSFSPSYEAFLRAVHPDDRAAVHARYSASLREGQDGYEIEHRVMRAGTGEVRIVHERCEHLRDQSGRVVLSQGMVHDITDRKRAEAALEQSEERLAQGVRAAGLGIFEHDHRTDVIELSPLMRHLLGFSEGDKVTIAGILQKVVPEDRETLAAKIRRAHDPSGEGHFEVDYRVLDESGRLRWISARSQTFFEGESNTRQAVRTIGAALDVTPVKKAQEALSYSEERFRSLVRASSEVLYRMSPDWGEMRQLAGESFRDDTSQPMSDWFELYVPAEDQERVRVAIQEAIARKGPFELEHQLRRADGSVGWTFSRAVPLLDEHGEIAEWFGAASDITARKQAEERVRASLREKEVMLKEIHHRVKNNLQVIASLVDMQTNALRDPALGALFQDVRDRVRTMAMVHEKLYQTENLARLDLAAYTNSLLVYLARAHGNNDTSVELKLDLDQVWLSVQKAVPFGLVLNELVTNAFRHAFRGRTKGELTVGLRAGPGGQVCLRVQDNGVGLPEKMDWRRSPSLGLQLIDLLAGQLRAAVEVQQDGGTQFSITFESDSSAEKK